MEKELWFDGQRVLTDSMEFEQDARVNSTKKRLSDIWSDGTVKGLYDGFAVSIDSITNTYLNVGKGVGYKSGERIIIDTDAVFDPTKPQTITQGVLTPQSTGNRAVTLADYSAGVDNYIWVEYLGVINNSSVTINPADGTTHYVEQSDGYQIVVTTTNPPNNPLGITYGLFLGRVTANGAGSAITGLTDLLSRQYLQLSVLDGITSLGIQDGAITTGKLASQAVTQGKVSDNAIGNAQIIDGAVDSDKIATNGISYSNMKVGSVRGSTANSGGSAQEVELGSISTPDIRANAVSTYDEDSSGNASAGTAIGTVTITTLGGPVFITAHANIEITVDGPSEGGDVYLIITRPSVSLSGNYARWKHTGSLGAVGTPIANLSLNLVDTPAAGTYTYTLSYTVAVGTFNAVDGHAIKAQELRK